MKLILRNTTIIDPKSTFHKQVVDICINNGIIEAIDTNLRIEDSDKELEIKGLHTSLGWFDTSVSFGEPGYEERETIQNGLEVAATCGFTGIALQPNTNPITDNQSQIHFLKQKASETATELFPIGALTKNSDGKDLAELLDMKKAGAIAFGDYGKSLSNTNLMKIALQYVQDFDGLILSYCQDEFLKGNGVANEGVAATKLGLKGIPNLAEEIMVARNLFLLEHTGGKLHLPTISTAKSAQLIHEAKQKGLQVSCSVSVHHLVLNDEELDSFDSRKKVAPPLRNEMDRKALINYVLDGTIDCITTDHNPIDIENKKLEFDLAKNGTLGLESAFGALMTILPLEIIIEKLTSGREVFGIESNSIAISSKANLSFFTIDEEYRFDTTDILSKSKNSAFLGLKMKGRVLGSYNNGKLVVRENG